MSTLDGIDRIAVRLAQAPLPQADKVWGGAGVVLRLEQSVEDPALSQHPDDNYVVTPYALELSWLFGELRDAFAAEGRLDHLEKRAFFNLLADAANELLASEESASVTAQSLCMVVFARALFTYGGVEFTQN